MKIDEETYKGFVIESHYNEESKFFYATSTIANSANSYYKELKNHCRGFLTPKEAVDNVKLKIDAFLEIAPKTYAELATAITESLVWTGYEHCYADEFIIQKLVERFIKTQNS